MKISMEKFYPLEFSKRNRLGSLRKLRRRGTAAPYEPQVRYFGSDVPRVLPTLQNALWYPKVPPLEMRAVAAASSGHDDGKFSYLDHTIFAQHSGAAEHLIRVSVFIDVPPFHLGITGFQFHFDDRECVPPPFSIPGKEVSALIDGPGGETILSIDILRSDTAKYAGLKVRYGCLPTLVFAELGC